MVLKGIDLAGKLSRQIVLVPLIIHSLSVTKMFVGSKEPRYLLPLYFVYSKDVKCMS